MSQSLIRVVVPVLLVGTSLLAGSGPRRADASTALQGQQAAQAPQPPTFLDAKSAGPDFLVQGEYVGRAGQDKHGIQVIALGGGKFEGVFFEGGLPGDGWDGKPPIRMAGSTTGELTEFMASNSGWKFRIGGDRVFGERDSGDRFTARKVERASPTIGLKPPTGAVVLFDGKDVANWDTAKLTEDGLLEPGARTKSAFRDFQLHLEFRTPFRPTARGQQRGNSGLYILGAYEVQILDSFGLPGTNNECGALYREKAPEINVCFPPLTWQTYDVEFQAARFDAAGMKTANARITLKHNGVVVQKDVELAGPTGGARRRVEPSAPGTLLLQNHRNPVHFRNIWILNKGS